MLIIVNHCSFLMIFMVITDSGLLLTTYYTRIPSGLLRHFKQCIEQVILYCMALDGSRNPSASSGLAHRNESMTMFDHKPKLSDLGPKPSRNQTNYDSQYQVSIHFASFQEPEGWHFAPIPFNERITGVLKGVSPPMLKPPPVNEALGKC